MTILISGATGFLGSYLLKHFIDNGHDVIGLKRSKSNTYRIDDYLSKCKLYNIDEIDMNQIFKNHSVDVVTNTVTNYGREDKRISSIVKTNLLFGLELLEVSIEHKVKAFLNTDTLLEKDINAYALSKSQLVSWMKLMSKNDTKLINIKIEHMYGLVDDENKFIYWLINQLKDNVKSINLTSGIQKRDFVYVDDIVSAYDRIIKNIDTLENFTEFELGSGNSVEVKEFIQVIYNKLQKTQDISTNLNFGAIDYRDNENMNMQADISKLNKLGWYPSTSIEDGIKKILDGEKEND